MDRCCEALVSKLETLDTIQPRTQGCLSTTLVQREDVLHFDWLIKRQNAKSKILESSEIIIAKTNFEHSKWQKENQNQRNKLYNMSLKLCKPKDILEKNDLLMLRHICYDTNGSALKASGTLMDTLKVLSQRHTED